MFHSQGMLNRVEKFQANAAQHTGANATNRRERHVEYKTSASSKRVRRTMDQIEEQLQSAIRRGIKAEAIWFLTCSVA